MDHIPNVDGPRLSIEIPYLLNKESLYDRKGWYRYPARAGCPQLAEDITVDELNYEYQRFQKHDFQAFAQAWMFFGVLHEFLGPDFSEADFIVQQSPGSDWRICTAGAKEWQVISKKKNTILWRPSHPPKSLANSWGLLTYLPKINAKCLLWDAFAKDKDDLWVHLALSFRLVYELLASVTHELARAQERDHRYSLSPTPGPSLDTIRACLLGNNTAWCVHQVDFLSSMLSYTALVYLTGFSRPNRDGVDHSECRKHDSCVAFNVKIGSDFVTAHAEPGCVCKYVDAPHQERTQILQRGGIPVLSCEQNAAGSFDLHFLPASPDVKYAAISHVWADGLGNAFGNSLPHCQLSRLVGAVRRTDKTFEIRRKRTLLWLDVYCVPAQVLRANDPLYQETSSEENLQRELKQHAIARMGATYAWAKYVLVIDRELARIVTQRNSAGLPEPQGYLWSKRSVGPRLANTIAVAALMVSAWNTRCWTYHEHTLAKTSVLQGTECSLQVNTLKTQSPLIAHLQEDFLRLASRQSVMGGGLTTNASRDDSNADIPYSSKFSRAWNAFYGRSTSQWEDMIAVLATLLDLDAAAVLKLRPRDRMRAILGSQTSLPLSLLSVDMVRLGHSGAIARIQDRWIPSHIQSVPLKCPRAGDVIEVRESGLFLHEPQLSQNAASMVRLPLHRRRIRPGFWHAFSSSLPQSRYWLRIDHDQIEACARVSFHEPEDVILVLELLDHRLGIDHSITLRGTCLMPSGPVSHGIEPVVYICAFEWGIEEFGIGQDTECDPERCAQALPVASGSGVLITSDIASWSKLPPSRAHRFKILAALRRTIIGLMATICSAWAAWWLIGLGGAAGVSAVCLLISAPVHGMAYVFHLQMMYSVHPELNNNSSWRQQYLEIFRLSSFREVAWHHWPCHAVLWLVVMTISIPSMIGQRAKQIARHGRKPCDDQDVQLEALL